MIIVNKNGTLIHNKIRYKCAIGKKGITKKKREGDKKTPKGNFSLENLYFRKDRIKYIKTNLNKIPITKKMGWCDDTSSKYYNKLIRIPNKLKHEKMFRNDETYDLVIPIKYNFKNPIKNKGSAIFLHICKDNFDPTEGCIAVEKKNLLNISKQITTSSCIIIEN